jgi:HEPN domain-containing protein/predicted nucleotidyltransferase
MPPAVADPFLVAITKTIVDRFAPERVVLFGSRARGDHEPDSDYDLIVVLDTPLERRERDRPIRDALRGAGHHVDVIVYTPAEFERSRHDVGALAYAGETEGQLLYDRTPSRWPRHVREEPRGTPESLAAWVTRAESDFAAMADIAAGSQSPDAISFHAHQAAEKFLKAALIQHHIPPSRTHLLSELLGRCVADLRNDPRVARACALLEALWPQMRYPDHAAPTLEKAGAAMAAAHEVRAAVMQHMVQFPVEFD